MIDDATRERVLSDVQAHWIAGRIGADEHERRTVIARNASTRADLARALEGLPDAVDTRADMPVLGGPPQGPAAEAPGGPEPLEGRVLGDEVERPDLTQGLVRINRSTARAISALVPILAVLAFFTTQSWLWFLAIPIVSIVLYGKGGDGGRG